MDPMQEKSSGMALPQPLGGLNNAAIIPPDGAYGASDHPSMGKPLPSPQFPSQPMANSTPLIPMQQMNPAGAPDTVVSDDSPDSLDKEWVNKAKSIVEQTKNDPYTESKELSKVKADYLRIRYNKLIKIAEDQ